MSNITVTKTEKFELTCHAKIPKKKGGFRKDLAVWTVPTGEQEVIDAVVQNNRLITYYNLTKWEILTHNGISFRPEDPLETDTYFIGCVIERNHLDNYKSYSPKLMQELVEAMDRAGTDYAIKSRMGDLYPLHINPTVHVIEPIFWMEVTLPGTAEMTFEERPAFQLIDGGKTRGPKVEP